MIRLIVSMQISLQYSFDNRKNWNNFVFLRKKKFGMEITVLVALNEESWCKV